MQYFKSSNKIKTVASTITIWLITQIVIYIYWITTREKAEKTFLLIYLKTLSWSIPCAQFKDLYSCQYLWNLNYLSLPRAKLLSFYSSASFLYANKVENFDNLSHHVSISLTDCYAMLGNTATILNMLTDTRTLKQTCERRKDKHCITHTDHRVNQIIVITKLERKVRCRGVLFYILGKKHKIK